MAHEHQTGEDSTNGKDNRAEDVDKRQEGVSPFPKDRGIKGKGRKRCKAAKNACCEEVPKRLDIGGIVLDQPSDEEPHCQRSDNIYGQGADRKTRSEETQRQERHEVASSRPKSTAEHNQKKMFQFFCPSERVFPALP